ncbi:MAG: hypothetical protein ABIQ73_02745 [Acidimicrobiales bacterium]
MADLSDVTITAENDGISATCRLCEGRKDWRAKTVNLAEIIVNMSDHLRRDHGDEQP